MSAPIFDDVLIAGYHVYTEPPAVMVGPAIEFRDTVYTYNVTYGMAEVRCTARICFPNPAEASTVRALRNAVAPSGVPAAMKAYGFDAERSSTFGAYSTGGGDFLAADITFVTHIS